MIFGHQKNAFGKRKNGQRNREKARIGHYLKLQLLRTGLSLVGIAAGCLGSAAVIRLPVSMVLANAEVEEELLTAAGEPHIASRLPENTPYAMFFSTQDGSLAALEQFELFARIADLTGGLTNPLGLPFLPLGFDAQYEGDPWAGEQSAIALLPETAPRRVSPTDLDAKFYSLTQIVNQADFVDFVIAVETARAEAPELTMYQGAALWVWPARTASFSDSDFEQPDVKSEAKSLDNPSDEATKLARANSNPTSILPERSSDIYGEPTFGDSEDGYVVPGLAIAQIDNYAVIAANSQTVKDVIEYQLRASSLAENELFSRSQYHQQADALVHVYANMAETYKFDLSDRLPDFAQLPIPPGFPALPAMPDFFSVESRLLASRLTQGITIEAIAYPQSEGLRFQGRLYGNEVIRPVATPDLPEANSAIQYVPAPAYTLGSGRNLSQFWQRVASFLAVDQTTQGFLDQARFLVLSATGLDLDDELIGWIDQEIAFFSFPSNEGLLNSIFPGAGVELGLAVQTSDRPKAETALTALGEVAQDFVSTEIAVDTRVNDSPAINWRIPAEGNDLEFSFLGHSWVSEDTVMFTSGIGAMGRVLNATAFEPLDEHPTFLNATRSLASPNNGYSYINASSSLSLIYGFVEDWFQIEPNDPFFTEAKSYLGTVRSLSGTTSSTTDYWQLDSLVNLAPAETDIANTRLESIGQPSP